MRYQIKSWMAKPVKPCEHVKSLERLLREEKIEIGQSGSASVFCMRCRKGFMFYLHENEDLGDPIVTDIALDQNEDLASLEKYLIDLANNPYLDSLKPRQIILKILCVVSTLRNESFLCDIEPKKKDAPKAPSEKEANTTT